MHTEQARKDNRFDDLFIHPIYIRFKNSLWNYRIRKSAVLKELNIAPDRNILEVGAGIAPMVPATMNVVYTDLSNHSVAFLKNKYSGHECIVSAAEAMPFTDSRFDIVVSSEVLEHVTEDALALGEVCRVLKPGGKLILTVPAHHYFFSDADRFVGHVRRYNPEMLSRMLAIAGFERVSIHKIAGILDQIAMQFAVAIFRISAALLAKKRGVRSSSGAFLLQLFFPVYWILNLAYTFFVWLESKLIPMSLATVILVSAEKSTNTGK